MANDQALLTFSLGPVQTFVAAARSVRDLWTGSFILSWLTWHAMQPVRSRHGDESFVFPNLETHPFALNAHGEALRCPSLPNRFLAEVDEGHAQQLADECRKACEEEWRNIVRSVFDKLKTMVDRLPSGGPHSFDRTVWTRQVESFFEIRTFVLPASAERCPPESVHDLLPQIDAQKFAGPDGFWKSRWKLLQGMLAATRSVRHVPNYAAAYIEHAPGQAGVPAKCSVLGTFEQLGPSDLGAASKYWQEFSEKVALDAACIRSRERLCAVSLVKRFAWFAYLKQKAGITRRDRGLDYEDTATIAAAKWLEQRATNLNPKKIRRWNGQWLHWARPDQDPDEQPCAKDVWDRIRNAKREHGEPPAYYAIVAIDGDRIGQRLVNANREEQGEISRVLTGFAVDEVLPIVDKDHWGTVVYAGGDDVLFLCPAVEAARCADRIRNAFGVAWRKTGQDELTLSCGITIAHYKEDLRFALESSRQGEQFAKHTGRNAVAFAVCKRSGEHIRMTLPWTFARTLSEWTENFEKSDVSNRWTYHLARELPTLAALPERAVAKEIERLIERAEKATQVAFPPATVTDAFRNYCRWTVGRTDEHGEQLSTADAVKGFVLLLQAASFLARGGDR